MTMPKMSTSNRIGRRTLLGAIAATGAFTLARPRLVRAQESDIHIGVLLPFTGSQGAYGPDMRKAAELTARIINDAAIKKTPGQTLPVSCQYLPSCRRL